MNNKKYKNEEDKLKVRRESKKKWRLKNPEYNRKYYLNNLEKIKAYNQTEKAKKSKERFRNSAKGKVAMKIYSKKYYQKYKDDETYKLKVRHFQKNYTKTEKYKNYQSKFKKENKQYFKDYAKKYSENPKYIAYKKRYTKSEKGIEARKRYKKSQTFKNNHLKRMKNDLNYKFRILLRNRVRAVLNEQFIKDRKNKTLDLIGCDLNFLKEHIEKQFKSGMSWNNWSKYGWHLDHIKPCASFNLTKDEEQKKCFNFTNLQPLWATENLKKSNKIIERRLYV